MYQVCISSFILNVSNFSHSIAYFYLCFYTGFGIESSSACIINDKLLVNRTKCKNKTQCRSPGNLLILIDCTYVFYYYFFLIG